jgi:hypothetical protein
MKQTGFKTPAELKPEDAAKVPISGRISEADRAYLEKAAKREGMSLSSLIGRVLEDYAAWLRGRP